MDGYQTNNACILDYLALFQQLGAEQPQEESCRQMWQRILTQEAATPEDIPLSPSCLRQRFALCERDFLLVMAALALEMDGEMRSRFRRRYGLNLPTLEYGLQLISAICPSSCETVAELNGAGALDTLLMTAAESTGYPIERPLILCRSAFVFLAGFQIADIPGCTLQMEPGAHWLALHEKEREQVAVWYENGTAHPLSLLGLPGSGRRTLLHRVCGRVICADLTEIAPYSALDQRQILQNIVVLARLSAGLVCAQPDADGQVKRALAYQCRRHQIPLVFLAETESELTGAGEVVRLPRQLTAQEREMAWAMLVPHALPDAQPNGAMTIGALCEIAARAAYLAEAAGRQQVTCQDVRQATLGRSGALEFGVCHDLSASMADMVLPEPIREQLALICQAARCASRLSRWRLPQSRAGVTAVFHGPSGTGKTMAASAIAHELGMPLLRADLSQIMDKYIGETEKHLGRLFQCARENHCVLLFDEADALFGKRTTTSTGQDKYANVSTSYLLQEMEQYDGVALLSTNLLSNFDNAFLRRLQYIIRFPMPDACLREQLWRRAITEDRRQEEIPFEQLAQAELSPARIYAAARNAAVMAIAAGHEQMNTAQIIAALRLELEKTGKSLPRELAQRLEQTGGI